MLTDITLGQYLPGETVIHKLDPRTKILLTIAYIMALFFVNTIAGFALCAVFMGCILKISGIPLKFIIKSIKPLWIFVIFTAIINIFMTDGKIVFQIWVIKATWEGIYLAVIMSLRLIFLVMGTSILTYTTSPIVLTDGIEHLLGPFRKIKVPAHEIAMMMTIAIRFIPTIIEETDKLMKAQSARGADFESGNLMARAKAMVPILVPLFVSAFRRADELALAMECRCYHGGDQRTKMKQLHMQGRDTGAFFIAAVSITLLIGIRYLPGLI